MALATAGGTFPVNFDQLDLTNLLYGTPSVKTGTQFTVTYSDGTADNFFGTNFTYDGYGNPGGGTITSFNETHNGANVYTVTNVAVPVASFLSWVESGSTYTALSNIFSGADTVTGSEFSDLLRGYGGDDRLDGGQGVDTLIGGSGNDTYVVTNSQDQIYENYGEGNDQVLTTLSSFTLPSNVEALVYTGSDSFTASGDSYANTLDAGGASSATLVGGGGGDNLKAAAGPTVFIYNLASDSGAGGTDHITGFKSGTDKLDLSLVSGAHISLLLTDAEGTSVSFALDSGGTYQGGIELNTAIKASDVLTSPNAAITIYGSSQADSLAGGAAADFLSGGGGADTLTGGAGSDKLYGDDGSDTAAYSGFAHDYLRNLTASGGTITGGPEGGTDTLTSVENVAFLDGILTFDSQSTAAQVVRLYDSFLGRSPDVAGFNSYLNFVASGHSFQDMADNAASSPEFANATANLTDTQYVTYVYEHSLHREPDAGGLQTYVTDLENGTLTRTSLIVQAAESPEHVALTSGVVAQGLWIPDAKVESLELLYDASVQRQPDAYGIAGYTAEIAQGLTFKEIANQMSQSAEFLSHHASQSDADYIDSLYLAEVGRHADAFGLNAYEQQLQSGSTRGDILYETAMSQEHQSHVLAFYDPLLVG